MFDTDLYALNKAFQYATKASASLSQIQDVWIFSNSLAAIQRVQSNYIKAGQNRVNSIARLATKLSLEDIRLHLQWVPAHMGIEGNEEVDKAAKSGTLKTCCASDACVSLENIYPLNEDVLVSKLGYSFAELALINDASIAAAANFGPLETKPGDTVIIAPSRGHFGGIAVQVALAMGSRVIAAGRNPEALARLTTTFKATGRIATVQLTGDPNTDTAALKLEAGGDGQGADAYVDWSPPQAPGSHIPSCIKALRFNGKCAFMGAVLANVEVPYVHMVLNNIRVQGRYMYTREMMGQVVKMVEADVLRLGRRGFGGFELKGFKIGEFERMVEAEEARWGRITVLEP